MLEVKVSYLSFFPACRVFRHARMDVRCVVAFEEVSSQQMYCYRAEPIYIPNLNLTSDLIAFI